MEPVHYQIDKALLMAELSDEIFLRKTNRSNNEIYIFNGKLKPNLMKEVGRLRELTFRSAGGGTGKELDIDDYDINSTTPYKQLIVWDPKDQEILGGYRYVLCDNLSLNKHGEPNLATTKLFKFSSEFKKDTMPKMIELGRSFVQPIYQSSKLGRKSLFALDNLWDGLGALTIEYPEMDYFFGKVTMYTSFNVPARNLIIYFLNKYFKGDNKLVCPINNLHLEIDQNKMKEIFTGETYKENYRILAKNVRSLGENIPPLINAYMNLSPSMQIYGTSINPSFGGVEETAIIIKISDVYETKIKRHINTYIPRTRIRLNMSRIHNMLNKHKS